MATIRSKHQFPVLETDFLSYLFDTLYNGRKVWPSDEPIFLSPPESQYPSYTFDQIQYLSKCLASGLERRFGRGTRAMVCGTSNVHLQIALLGAMGGGASVNPCPPAIVQDHVTRIRQLKPDYMLVDCADIDNVLAAAAEADLPSDRIFSFDHLIETADRSGPIQHWSILYDFEQGPMFQWRRLSNKESKETTALYIYTSGSTGPLKLSERTHAGMANSIEEYICHHHLIPREKEIVFCTFRATALAGLMMGLLAPLKARSKSIFVGQCDLQEFLGIAKTFRPTFMSLPKPTAQHILEHAPDADFTSVTETVSAGALIPISLREAWLRQYGSPCRAAWGQTELGMPILPDPRIPPTFTDNSLGDLSANYEAKVVDVTSGQVLGRNQAGELLLKSPVPLKGYLDKPVQSAEALTGDGWFRTGDLFRVDEKDQWHMMGRIKDLFKHGANHVSACEIETALLLHPKIVDASVIAVNMPGDDEPVPRGYLVKRSGSELQLEEFFQWMTSTLAPRLHLLGGVGLLDSLPLSNTGNGKPDRALLKEMGAKDIIAFPESLPKNLPKTAFKSG